MERGNFLTGTLRSHPCQLATGRLEVPNSARSRPDYCHLLTVQPLAEDFVPGCRFLLPLLPTPSTPRLELADSSELSHGIPVWVEETHPTLTPNPAFQVHRARVLPESCNVSLESFSTFLSWVVIWDDRETITRFASTCPGAVKGP